MIQLHGVHKTLGGRDILCGLDLKVPEGLNYVLMGRSGSGKSVTLKHVIGVFRPDQGSVQVDGVEVPELQRNELQSLRRRMGYLFQNGALINWLSVFENVALPLRENGEVAESEIQDRVCELLKLVGMDHAAAQYPASISGGMKLRTGLARALVSEPSYVLYDEPNAGLDPIMADQIHRLIVKVNDELGVTGLVVTHSQACAVTVADRIGLIEDGRIGEEGTLEDAPAQSRVAAAGRCRRAS